MKDCRSPTLAVLITVTTLFAIDTAAYAEPYDKNGFHIEYPDDWDVQDSQWESAHMVRFVSGIQERNSITISLHDEYPVTNPYEQETIPMTEMDLDTLDFIASDTAYRCRINADGSCWNFNLVDSKIVTISYERAAQLDFEAKINDRNTSIRLLVMPTDSGIWIVRGASTEPDATESVLEAVETFALSDTYVPAQIFVNVPEIPTESAPADPRIILERILNINLIMVGQKWSPLDIDRILEGLPSRHDPVFTTTGEKVGVRYHYAYNFVSSHDSTDELVRLMDENSRDARVFGSGIFDFAFWQEWWLKGHPDLHDIQYRVVDAAVIEEYIQENIIDGDPDLGAPSSVNLVFLNIPPDEMGHIQNYYTSDKDKATGERIDFVGLMGFGGDAGNTFFFDMWAVPWIDYDPEHLHHIPPYMANLHDCRAAHCITDMVTLHTESAIYHILTPSFLYPIEFHDKYFLDILVYLKPGDRITVTPATLPHFVNAEDILGEMEYLYPFAEWEMEISVERRDLRGLSYEFKQQIKQVERVEDVILGETISYELLSTDRLKPYLIEWAQQRLQERRDLLQDTWVIPILIVIDNTRAEVLLDSGALGMAPGMPGNESAPCCAFAVTDERDVWENKIGLDNLILHEVGHVMGLHHPFIAFKYGGPIYNGYFNWYESPMTYSHPSLHTACGIFYSVFYGGPCGNAATSFTEFERERIADARLVSILKRIDAEMDSLTAEEAEGIKEKVDHTKQIFAAGKTLSMEGALASALEAYGELEAYMGDAGIPEWVKSSAGWWADGLIGDLEFVASIEYLIKVGVITVDAQTDPGNTQQKQAIPSWVKNSAGWWSQGLLSNDEFTNSIGYLISRGIIQT